MALMLGLYFARRKIVSINFAYFDQFLCIIFSTLFVTKNLLYENEISMLLTALLFAEMRVLS